jgi:hypothetical protein
MRLAEMIMGNGKRANEPSNEPFDSAKAEKIAHLIAARGHLENVLDTLDLSERSCTCCGASRYTNYDDQQLGKKLSGMVEKIDVEVGKMRGTIAKSGKGDFHGGTGA